MSEISLYLEDVSEIGRDLRLAPYQRLGAHGAGNHHTLQPARGKGEGLRLAEQRLHVEAPEWHLGRFATSASHARTINLILKSQSYLAAEIRS